MFFHKFQDNPVVASMFRGIRPAVVALIAAPCFSMARSAHITLSTAWIPVVCCLLIVPFGFSPILVILIAAVGGFIYGKIKSHSKS